MQYQCDSVSALAWLCQLLFLRETVHCCLEDFNRQTYPQNNVYISPFQSELVQKTQKDGHNRDYEYFIE